jgi:hypothetical protein
MFQTTNQLIMENPTKIDDLGVWNLPVLGNLQIDHVNIC